VPRAKGRRAETRLERSSRSITICEWGRREGARGVPGASHGEAQGVQETRAGRIERCDRNERAPTPTADPFALSRFPT